MFSTNLLIIEFITGNFILLSLLLSILKILAVQTKWAGDDQIITFLFEFIKNPKGGTDEKIAE